MSKYLDLSDLISLCSELSHSQGFYGRLLCNLQGLNDEAKRTLDEHIKAHKFTDDLDLILWLEC